MARVKLALAVLLNEDGQVALQRRPETSKFYPGMLSLFGGHMNPGEEPLEAANRELLEELGVTAEQTRLLPLLKKLFDAVIEYADPIKVTIFHGILPPEYTISETDGALELFTVQDAVVQPDLVPTAQSGLEEYANQEGA